MKYTVKEFNNKQRIYTDKKFKTFKELQGYVFKDEYNNTIMIVYGESRRDFICDELSSKENVLNLQYQIIDFNKK